MKLVVADDHPLVRDTLARTVLLVEPEALVFGADGYVATESDAREYAFDLALMELHIAGMDGIAGILRLRELSLLDKTRGGVW